MGRNFKTVLFKAPIFPLYEICLFEHNKGWIGSSRKDLMEFPDEVIREMDMAYTSRKWVIGIVMRKR